MIAIPSGARVVIVALLDPGCGFVCASFIAIGIPGAGVPQAVMTWAAMGHPGLTGNRISPFGAA
jgi:hypothetical protein